MKTNVRFNNPWVVGIQGVLMIIFGVAAIVNPEITITTITRFFGVLLVLGGIFLIFLTNSNSNSLPVFWMYEGIVNIVIGLLFIVFPKLIANIFVFFIGVIALIIGIRNLWILVKNKPQLVLLNLIRNAILVTFGLLFLFVPFQGAMVIVNVIGIVALIYGAVTVIMSYKLFQIR